MKQSRRRFLQRALMAAAGGAWLPGIAAAQAGREVMGVHGPLPANRLGRTLIHEHLLVDFIGAAATGYHRWERAAVVRQVLPYLQQLADLRYQSLFDCTPAFLGRDPWLLQTLSERSGLNIVTNTGYYGAGKNKYLPPQAFTDDADALAARWLEEWEKGIEGSGVRPGFMKISVDQGPLSAMHEKLVRAAARCHRESGLTIASHTGTAVGAFEEIAVIEDEGVSPEAFVWVHAQAEKNLTRHLEAAARGTWISLDGVSEKEVPAYVSMLVNLKAAGHLNRTLISHDAGWYSPGEPEGGRFRPYTDIDQYLIPALRQAGFSDADLVVLLVDNPAAAFHVHKRLRA